MTYIAPKVTSTEVNALAFRTSNWNNCSCFLRAPLLHRAFQKDERLQDILKSATQKFPDWFNHDARMHLSPTYLLLFKHKKCLAYFLPVIFYTCISSNCRLVLKKPCIGETTSTFFLPLRVSRVSSTLQCSMLQPQTDWSAPAEVHHKCSCRRPGIKQTFSSKFRNIGSCSCRVTRIMWSVNSTQA